MTTLKVIIGHIIIFVSLHTITAQYNQKLDSIIKVYNSLDETDEKIKTISYLFNAVVYTDPESGYNYALEELALSHKLNKLNGIGMGHYHLSSYFSLVGNLDSSHFHLNKAMLAFRQANSIPNQGLVYSAIADEAFSKGNYDLALDYTDSVIDIFQSLGQYYRVAVMQSFKSEIYNEKGSYYLGLNEAQKALDVLDTIDKPVRRAELMNTIANIELQLGHYNSAISYGEIAVPVFEKYEDNLRLAEACITIGKSYTQLNEFTTAYNYYQKVLEITEAHKLIFEKAEALLGIGMVNFKKENSEQALLNFSQAIRLFQNSGYQKQTAIAQYAIGQVYYKTQDFEKALVATNTAIETLSTIEAKDDLAQAYQLRSKIHEEKGNTQKAFMDYKRFHSLKDSVLNITIVKQIEEMRAIFDSEIKDHQISNQLNEIFLLKQKAKINKLKSSILVFSIISLFIVFAFGFYAYKQRIRRHRLEEQKTKVELDFKRKEITSNALHLAKKNALLENLKEQVKVLKTEKSPENTLANIIQTINFNLQDENNWENFKHQFDTIHKDFNSILKTKYPEITSNELRLLSLMKMNLSSKEIANILNISNEGIKKARYRLRKKLKVESDATLQDIILKL